MAIYNGFTHERKISLLVMINDESLNVKEQHGFAVSRTVRSPWKSLIYTIWLFNIAMGNGPFIEVYLLKMVIFHGYVSHNQRV